MDQATLLIVIAAILALLVGIVLWRRGGDGSIALPGGFKAEIKDKQTGPALRDLDFEGNRNVVDAKGPGAVIERVNTKGDDNNFKAG